MRSRPQWLFVSALLLAVALAAVTLIGLASKPLQIAWHRHKMQRAWDESQVAEDATESFTRFESHLETLVSLGSVSKRGYRFKHLRIPTEESKHIWSRIYARDCPPWLNVTATWPRSPEPMVLTIWYEHEHRSAWDEFLRAADRPDYRDRFMATPGKGEAAGGYSQ